jgi:hypothetical protein
MHTLERRIESLEALRKAGKPAAWLIKPGLAEPPSADSLSAQERYIRMLNGLT